MQIQAWRVIWYDAEGHEIGSADFVHESDAHRKMDRVREERLGRSVTLNRMRQTEEEAAAGSWHDGWDLVEEWDIT
jgi:hypothetical protein